MLAVGALALRATRVRWAFIDFHDTIYWPARAFIDGLNPYDTVTYLQHYPANPFPPFAPLTLALYAPLALLERDTAAWTWFAINVGLTLGLAAIMLRCARIPLRPVMVIGLVTIILASRPGGMNLVLGQQTMPLVLAAYVALLGAERRPALAVLGVALSTGKPQFGVPLAVLLAAAGHVRVSVLGLATSGLLSLCVLMLMPPAAGSDALGTFLGAASASAARIEGATTVWWSRIDLPYLAHHLLGESLGRAELLLSLATLGAGALLARRLARRRAPGDRELMLGVITLSALLAVYHQVYDTLLLAVPVTLAIVGGRDSPWERHPRLRWAIVALLVFPAVNFVATFGTIERLDLDEGWWRVVTAVNAASLVVAFLLYAVRIWGDDAVDDAARGTAVRPD